MRGRFLLYFIVKVVLSQSRKTLKEGYRMNRKLQDHTTWVQLITQSSGRCLLLFKVYCHIVGKRDRIHCRKDTDWTISSRILHCYIVTLDQHNNRKMPFVFKVKSLRLIHIVGKHYRQDTEWTTSSRVILLNNWSTWWEEDVYRISRSDVIRQGRIVT